MTKKIERQICTKNPIIIIMLNNLQMQCFLQKKLIQSKQKNVKFRSNLHLMVDASKVSRNCRTIFQIWIFTRKNFFWALTIILCEPNSVNKILVEKIFFGGHVTRKSAIETAKMRPPRWNYKENPVLDYETNVQISKTY